MKTTPVGRQMLDSFLYKELDRYSNDRACALSTLDARLINVLRDVLSDFAALEHALQFEEEKVRAAVADRKASEERDFQHGKMVQGECLALEKRNFELEARLAAVTAERDALRHWMQQLAQGTDADASYYAGKFLDELVKKVPR